MIGGSVARVVEDLVAPFEDRRAYCATLRRGLGALAVGVTLIVQGYARPSWSLLASHVAPALVAFALVAGVAAILKRCGLARAAAEFDAEFPHGTDSRQDALDELGRIARHAHLAVRTRRAAAELFVRLALAERATQLKNVRAVPRVIEGRGLAGSSEREVA